MAAQDQRGDAQALWRPAVGEAKYSNAAMAVHRPRRARRRECQRPERKAREQGLNHAGEGTPRGLPPDQAVRQDLKRAPEEPKTQGALLDPDAERASHGTSGR